MFFIGGLEEGSLSRIRPWILFSIKLSSSPSILMKTFSLVFRALENASLISPKIELFTPTSRSYTRDSNAARLPGAPQFL